MFPTPTLCHTRAGQGRCPRAHPVSSWRCVVLLLLALPPVAVKGIWHSTVREVALTPAGHWQYSSTGECSHGGCSLSLPPLRGHLLRVTRPAGASGVGVERLPVTGSHFLLPLWSRYTSIGLSQPGLPPDTGFELIADPSNWRHNSDGVPLFHSDVAPGGNLKRVSKRFHTLQRMREVLSSLRGFP